MQSLGKKFKYVNGKSSQGFFLHSSEGSIIGVLGHNLLSIQDRQMDSFCQPSRDTYFEHGVHNFRYNEEDVGCLGAPLALFFHDTECLGESTINLHSSRRI